MSNLQLCEKVILKCPLCGVDRENSIQGTYYTGEHVGNAAIIGVYKDKWYHFCPCRKIYYNDWQHIEQSEYDPSYSDKYAGSTHYYWNYAYYYVKILREHGVKRGKFIEIGCINDGLLDKMKEFGFETTAVDIFKRPSSHHYITADFEKDIIPGTYDVVWASHVFEHFKDPVSALRKAINLLAPGGLLFIAMPDLYFLDYKAPQKWGHWHMKEHHILWEMDQWVKLVEEEGLECVFKTRNQDKDTFICGNDFHTFFKKKGGKENGIEKSNSASGDSGTSRQSSERRNGDQVHEIETDRRPA